MIEPLDKIYYTQLFGENPQIYNRFGLAGHNGLDYRVKFIDTPLGRREVFAVMDGKVLEVKNEGFIGYGRYVRIEHRGNEQTIYAHLHSIKVNKGQQVKEGDVIAISNNTGFSTGAHLHFGWRPEGYDYNNGYKGYEDPLKLFNPMEKCYHCTTSLEDSIENITGNERDLDTKDGQKEAAEDLDGATEKWEELELTYHDLVKKHKVCVSATEVMRETIADLEKQLENCGDVPGYKEINEFNLGKWYFKIYTEKP